MKNKIISLLIFTFCLGAPAFAQKIIANGGTLSGTISELGTFQTGPGGLIDTSGITSIPDLSLWVAADRVSGTEGQSISTLSDLSGSGNNLTQGTLANQPTYSVSGVNGRPSLVFSGTAQQLISGTNFFDSSWNSSMSVFFVAAQNSNASTNSIPVCNGTNWQIDFKHPWIQVGFNNEAQQIFSATGDIAEPTLVSYVLSGSANHLVRVNGNYAQTYTTAIPVSLSGSLQVGAYAGGVLAFAGKIPELLIFKRALSSAEIRVVEKYLFDKYLSRRKQVVFLGDSLTLGLDSTYTAGSFAYSVTSLLGGTKFWHPENLALGGLQVSTLNTNATENLRYCARSGVDNIGSVWAGTNDLANTPTNTATPYAALVAACGKVRASFGKVVVATTLPRGTTAQFETDRNAYNALIRANWSSFADAIADVGSDSVIGSGSAQYNGTYYNSDKTHLLDAGYTIAAPYFANAIKYAFKTAVSGTTTMTSGTATIIDPNITATQTIVPAISGTGITTALNVLTQVSGTAVITSGTTSDAGNIRYIIQP